MFPESHQRRDCVKSPKSHPRQWVDGSGPAYRRAPRPFPLFFFSSLFLAFARKRIKTGTGGLVLSRSDLNHPPTAVGGI